MSIGIDHNAGGYCPKCEDIAARGLTAKHGVTLTGFAIESTTRHGVIALVHFNDDGGVHRTRKFLLYKNHSGAWFEIAPEHAFSGGKLVNDYAGEVASAPAQDGAS